MLSITPICIIFFFFFFFLAEEIDTLVVRYIWFGLFLLHLFEIIFLINQILLLRKSTEVKLVQMFLCFSFIPYILYYVWNVNNKLVTEN